MINLTSILVLLFSSVCSLSAQNLNLEIQIEGLENNDGRIMLQLYTTGETDTEVLHSEYFGRITEKSCTLFIQNLTAGEYGVQFFHDEDNNGELNTNMIGIPKEDFGFSNNPKISFGAPTYEEWKFYMYANKLIKIDPISF